VTLWTVRAETGEILGHYLSEVNMLAAMAHRLPEGARFAAFGSGDETVGYVIVGGKARAEAPTASAEGQS
jgi:hypothetical protein